MVLSLYYHCKLKSKFSGHKILFNPGPKALEPEQLVLGSSRAGAYSDATKLISKLLRNKPVGPG